MSRVYRNELAVTDTSIRRVYTLCPNTVFSPGIANPNTGVITGGQEPLACKSNCLIRCGTSGASSNKCVIDGTGTFGIFQIPYNLFPTQPKVVQNVVYQGITVDFFVSSGQIPVLAGSFFGDVTFQDCVFSNNSADPTFVLSEFVASPRSRSAALDATPDKALPGFVWKVSSKDDDLRRNLLEEDVEIIDRSIDLDSAGSDRAGSRRQLRASDIPADEGTDVVADGERILQTTGAFKVSFQKCVFDFNDPVRNARRQGGLSLIRFEGSTIKEVDSTVLERLGTIGATIIDSQFTDNVYNFNNDIAGYRSIIDFFSLGSLVMRRNCFISSPVKNYGVVTAQQGAVITNEDNFISKAQPGLKCSFIAFLRPSYTLAGCGRAASATKCSGSSTPFCFPGDATCDVQGRGKVMMRDIKLGDKVLVQGGKYESVYSFGHHARNTETQYLKLVTSDRFLDISKDHLVFVEGGRSVPASSVKVGDKLLLADGGLDSVVAISVTTKQGAFGPFTASGTVVVNGVTASNFVTLQDSENVKFGSIDTGFSYHFLAHTFEMPHRMWCQYVSACREEKYTPEGISLWLAEPQMIAAWFFEQSMVTMGLIGVPLLGILICMAHPVTTLVTLAAILVGIRQHRLRRKPL